MPPIGLRPIVERYSLPFLPFAQGAVSPLRACRSANRVGAMLADRLHVEIADARRRRCSECSAPSGLILRISRVPQPPEFEQPLLPPVDVGAPRGILRIVGARQIQAGGGLESSRGSARSSTCPSPTQRLLKMPSTLYSETISCVTSVMNSKLYGPSAQVTHSSGIAQCRRFLPVGVHRDPVRVRVVHVLVDRVRIGARDDDHVQLAAAGHQVAERVAVAQPLAAVVQRDLRRIVGDAAAGAQAGRVGMGAPEVVEPES